MQIKQFQEEKKKRKAICLALCTVSMISLFGMCAYAQAANEFEGGDGTASSPYLIADASQLELLRDTVNTGESYEGVSFKLNKAPELKIRVFDKEHVCTDSNVNNAINHLTGGNVAIERENISVGILQKVF